MTLCACGCGQEVTINQHSEVPNRFVSGHNISSKPRPQFIGPLPLCACGCGNVVNINKDHGKPNRFIHGHHNRNKPISEKQKLMLIALNTGRVVSEETKQKLRQINLGKKYSDETKQKHREAMTGFKHSEESKQKISKGRLGKYGGQNSPAWLGGLSFLPYCHKFNNTLKEAIRNRDNRTCQNCGVKENGQRHTVHHIHYDKDNCYPDLITLCNSCNSKANGDREYWEAFYMEKLEERGLLHWMV